MVARQAPRTSPASRAPAPAPTPRRERGTLEQTCPRCGVTVRVRSAQMAVRYCPHCMARARVATPMPLTPHPPH
jgi:hypothetical protein